MISKCRVGADDVHSLPAMNISDGLTSFNYADGCSWSSWRSFQGPIDGSPTIITCIIRELFQVMIFCGTYLPYRSTLVLPTFTISCHLILFARDGVKMWIYPVLFYPRKMYTMPIMYCLGRF